MAEPTTNLRVRISADLADIKSGLAVLRGDLAKVKSQGATALPNTRQFTSGLISARNALRGLFAGISVGAVFAGIVRNTEEAEEAVGQLRAGLLSTRNAAGVTVPEIQALAKSLQQVTKYGDDTIVRMSAVLATFTNIRGEIFKQAIPAVLDLSTRLGTDLSTAALQVGKALNMPIKGVVALSRAGVQFSGEQKEQIKSFIAAGNLMEAQKIILGELTTQMGGSAKAAANTFVGAVKQAGSAVGDLLEGDSSSGGLAEAKTAVQGFTQALREASTRQAFDALLAAVAKGMTALVTGLKSVLPVIKELLQNLDVLVVYLGVRLAAGAVAAAVLGFARLVTVIRALQTATLTLRAAMLALGGPIGVVIAGLAAGIFYLYKRTNEAKVAAQEHRKALADNASMARDSAQAALADAKAKRAQALETLNAARAVLAEKRARLGVANDRATLVVGEGRANRAGLQAATARSQAVQAQRQVGQAQQQLEDWTRAMIRLQLEIQQTEISSSAGADAATVSLEDTADKAKKAVKGVIDQAELMQDAVQREMALLDRQFEENTISIADYYGRKKALQEADIDAQIAQAQAEARTATTSEQQSKALTEIIKLQRQRAEIGPGVAREQAKAEEELAEKLGAVKLRLLEAEGQTARARRAQLKEEFRDLIIRLQAEGDAAGVALVRKLINVEAADAQLQQFEQSAREVIDRLQNAESSFSIQAEAGTLGMAEAERMLSRERDSALVQLRDLRSRVLAYLATLDPNSPEFKKALEGLRQLDGNIAQIEVAQDRLKQKFEDTLADSLTNLFTDIATGAKSAKEAFKDFVRSFLEGVARIIAQELALRAAKAIIGAISGRAHHQGGVVGSSGTVRHGLNPLIFGNAPRYHSGGFAGLRPNEVPAVLERGEEVITRKDPRHRLNGGRVAAGGIAISTSVNVESGGNASEQDARALGSLVTAKVKEVMTQESRQGGILWRMQNA